MYSLKRNIIIFHLSMTASITRPLSLHCGDAFYYWRKKKGRKEGNDLRKGLFSLTWPSVLGTLLVHHLFDSAPEQHPWGVMVKGLQRFAGAVGLLGGYAAGSLFSIGRRGGVPALPILFFLAVSLSFPLALGQRAERPLLPHPFHAACMLGIPLPPLHQRRSPEALATVLYSLPSSPSSSSSGCDSHPVPVSPQSPLPTSEPQPVTPSVRSRLRPFYLEKERQRQSSDNTSPSASSPKAHTYPLLSGPTPPLLPIPETSPGYTWLPSLKTVTLPFCFSVLQFHCIKLR